MRVCLGNRENYVCDLSICVPVCMHVCVHQVFVGVCLSRQSVLVSVTGRNLGAFGPPHVSVTQTIQ